MKTRSINLKPIQTEVLKLTIKGKTPYMPEPASSEVAERYNKLKSHQTYKKDDIPEEEKVKAKYYYTEDGKKGIPSRAIFQAMVRASSYLIEKKDGGMRIVREGVLIKDEILPLKYSKEKVETHMGKNSGINRSPRKIMRNAFYDWSVDVEIEYNKEQLSAEQIVNILNWAGFHIGVGAFRKEKTGNFGLFEVKI